MRSTYTEDIIKFVHALDFYKKSNLEQDNIIYIYWKASALLDALVKSSFLLIVFLGLWLHAFH